MRIILIRLHIGKRILQEKAPEISWFGSRWQRTPVAVSREIALINIRWQAHFELEQKRGRSIWLRSKQLRDGVYACQYVASGNVRVWFRS